MADHITLRIQAVFCRVVLVLVLIMPALTYSNAQSYLGIIAGCSINHMEINTSGSSYLKNNDKAGYLAEVPFLYVISDKLAIHAGVDVMRKNYTFARTGPYTGIYESFVNSYLSVPIWISWHIKWRKFGLLPGIGGYGAYWIHGKLKGKTANVFSVTDSVSQSGQITEYYGLSGYSGNYSFNRRRDERLEWGWTCGLQIEYPVRERLFIFAEGVYYQALTSQTKKYAIDQGPGYNQTVGISMGVMYALSKK